MKTFISKIITLLLISIIGSFYFVIVVYPPQKGFSGVIYYTLMMYPLILLYLSPGVLISYLVDLIKKYTKRTHIIFSVGMYFFICSLLLYIPFIIIQKENSTHAMFYFLFIPVLYGVSEFFVRKVIFKSEVGTNRMTS